MNVLNTFLFHQEGGCCGGHDHGDGCCSSEEKDHDCCSGHEGEHECTGCGQHNHHHTITLSMEDGSEMVCRILNYINHNNKQFIVLLHPNNQDVMIYDFIKNDDGSAYLDDIKDEQEFEQVVNIWNNYQAQQQRA